MSQIIFILVSPQREENVGASARAMKTMGFENLRLVAPHCDYLGQKSRATAHGSVDILEKAKVFETLQDSLFDISLAIASAAKKRNKTPSYQLVEDLPKIISSKGNTLRNVAIIFGGEESGLSNKELKLCDIVSTIPMRRKYPSLNLGQAVMVYATYLSKLNFSVAKRKTIKSSPDELKIVKHKADQILQDIQMDKQEIIYSRIMERLMLLEKDDINLFHSFCRFYLKNTTES